MRKNKKIIGALVVLSLVVLLRWFYMRSIVNSQRWFSKNEMRSNPFEYVGGKLKVDILGLVKSNSDWKGIFKGLHTIEWYNEPAKIGNTWTLK